MANGLGLPHSLTYEEAQVLYVMTSPARARLESIEGGGGLIVPQNVKRVLCAGSLAA